MTRFSHLLLAPLLAAFPYVTHAQAVTPADHPGFLLAEAIAADGCTLHQDDVNALLAELGLASPQFPQMAVPLMRDGYLVPGGEGVLALVNWGLCTGDEAEGGGAEGGVEAAGEVGGDAETEADPDADLAEQPNVPQPDEESTAAQTE